MNEMDVMTETMGRRMIRCYTWQCICAPSGWWWMSEPGMGSCDPPGTGVMWPPWYWGHVWVTPVTCLWVRVPPVHIICYQFIVTSVHLCLHSQIRSSWWRIKCTWWQRAVSSEYPLFHFRCLSGLQLFSESPSTAAVGGGPPSAVPLSPGQIWLKGSMESVRSFSLFASDSTL